MHGDLAAWGEASARASDHDGCAEASRWVFAWDGSGIPAG
jgi:hypothetical protein